MLIKSGLFAGLLALAVAVPASAAPYYDSLTTPAASGAALQTAIVGSSFTATGNTLSELEIALGKSSTFSPAGGIVITLNADNALTGAADGPGTMLYALQTINDSMLTPTGTEAIIDINSMGIVNLNPGSTYWIEISKTNSTKIVDYTTSSAPTIGSGSYATNTTGSFASAATPAMAFCVSADGSCVSTNSPQVASLSFAETGVPEPASMAILGTGLMGLGWSRRNKTKRFA